jgi:transposase-like protein
VESIAPKIGCVPQTLLDWLQRHEVDTGVRDGVTTAEAPRMKELERGQGAAPDQRDTEAGECFFAQAELDRRLKS